MNCAVVVHVYTAVRLFNAPKQLTTHSSLAEANNRLSIELQVHCLGDGEKISVTCPSAHNSVGLGGSQPDLEAMRWRIVATEVRGHTLHVIVYFHQLVTMLGARRYFEFVSVEQAG